MKVIVAGSRGFNDYKKLKQSLDKILSRTKNPIIVSGTAKGADQLGERYAEEKGLECLRYPADWNKYGKAAGYKRNKIMALKADALVAFWDGKSRGTKHMIELARNFRLKIKVIRYD